ncbi:sugar phosphate isomerase/epimerase family protein [Desulfitobacterium metallireducens]|uniref:Endonuclease n=1 Tax=Desulfitobacterium metallireducens DSM 15288 TaxID=871968 RepID=W0EFS9_9FIRM|nr:TIM barrel protein [Desulfitobacterium metallireducens]AHF08064.1 endonuclease [Desulfitobacterium metallireducens DSM 15288]
MNIAISNIAWLAEHDNQMYSYLQNAGFIGLEIAPTRIFPQLPYEKIIYAKKFANQLKADYGLSIPSMQSIWFGKSERIFGSTEERNILIDYTKKAIDFAEEIGCNNLVFGCPKNRIYETDNDINIATSFFRELGEYAKTHHTIFSMEPNPVLYGTNFINSTQEAFDFVKVVKCDGFKVNVDSGTILYNEESLHSVEDNIQLVNHIHISEPNLEVIKKRELHTQLAEILRKKDYQGFVSIEMRTQNNLDTILNVMQYIKEVFV